MISPAKLKLIEELAKKATTGPWRECGHDRAGGCCCGQVWSTKADVPVACTRVGDEEIGQIKRDVVVANAQFIAAIDPSTILALVQMAKDAQRYQWLRLQHWENDSYSVVKTGQVRLGTDCPTLDRLDAVIDAALSRTGAVK